MESVTLYKRKSEVSGKVEVRLLVAGGWGRGGCCAGVKKKKKQLKEEVRRACSQYRRQRYRLFPLLIYSIAFLFSVQVSLGKGGGRGSLRESITLLGPQRPPGREAETVRWDIPPSYGGSG